jgi:hypothetical protein
MVSKKVWIVSSFVLLIISAVFVSPTLTGNTIGTLTKNTSNLIGGFLVFLLGITISLSLKKK